MDGRQMQLQRLFLDRLKRMSWLAEQSADGPEMETLESRLPDEARRQLVFQAMFSTYLDCKQQGVEAEARSILGQSPMAESFRRALD